MKHKHIDGWRRSKHRRSLLAAYKRTTKPSDNTSVKEQDRTP